MTLDTLEAAGLEHELKFRLPSRHSHAALTYLSSLCRRDPKYPSNVVSSIYYDTPGLDLLGEKSESHHFKIKVRLRWYQDAAGNAASEASFLELKYRYGSRRKKLRVQAPLAARWLAGTRLDHPSLRDAPLLLASLQLAPPRGLHPMLVVRYRRHRFVDPPSGSRICLDTDVRPTRVNARRVHRRNPAPLADAVLEVKNPNGELPGRLGPLLRTGVRLDSFSKYGACFESVLGPSLGRH